jgi:hypothetical protein
MYCKLNNNYIDYTDYFRTTQIFRRYLICVIGILICVITALFINQEVYAFGIEPARLGLSIPAGRQRGRTVTIDNSNSDSPLHIKIYVQDIIFLPDGTCDFPPAGSTEWSCTNWLKVTPEEIDIPAGKTQDVRVNVFVPADAQGGYYAMVFFESGPAYIEQGLGINFRLGALVEVIIPNTELFKAKLANISFLKPNNIQVGIFNEGNLLIRPKGKIKVLDSQGKKIRQLDFNTQRLGILPKTLRKFYLELDKPLAKGQYRLKAEVDYGTRYLLVGELPIEIK